MEILFWRLKCWNNGTKEGEKMRLIVEEEMFSIKESDF